MSVTLDQLKAARQRAYVPYSGFRVGSAIVGLNSEGETITTFGCNFENLSYGATICAERNAVGAFVLAGGTRITEVHVISEGGVSPCGMCLQVLLEFSDPKTTKICRYGLDGIATEGVLADYLPLGFVSDAVARTDGPGSGV